MEEGIEGIPEESNDIIVGTRQRNRIILRAPVRLLIESSMPSASVREFWDARDHRCGDNPISAPEISS